MNFRELFTLILKVFGIYLLVQVINTLPQLIVGVSLVFSNYRANPMGKYYLLSNLTSILVYLYGARLFIRKTDYVISKLMNNEHMEINITSFKIHRSVVLSICLIVIAGLALFNEIPVFLGKLYDLKANIENFNEHTNSEYLIISIAKIAIAVYVISYNKFLVDVIEKMRKKV